MMTTSRDAPCSSSSTAAPRMRSPMRKRRTGGGAAAASAATLAVGFLILQALVGRAHACSVAITNNYNVSLSFYSFNGYDNICTVPYQVGSVPPGYESNSSVPGIVMDCTDAFGDSGCKIKIQGPGNCAGTVFVPCNDVMQFHYDANGQETFSITSGGNGATDDGGTGGGAQVASTPSLGEGVQQDGASGSGLRGAKGSRAMT